MGNPKTVDAPSYTQSSTGTLAGYRPAGEGLKLYVAKPESYAYMYIKVYDDEWRFKTEQDFYDALKKYVPPGRYEGAGERA